MLIISRGDIEKVINMRDAIEAVKRGFTALSAGKALVPLRVPIKIGEDVTLFMPGALVDDRIIGVKVVSVYPKNTSKGLPLIHAAILIIDGSNGIPTALIEGGYVTAIRTGAAGGAAAEALSRKNSEIAFVFGAGVQGRSQLEALCTVRNIKLCYVYDIDFQKAKAFEVEMKEKLHIEVKAIKDFEKLLPEADIIVTATTAKEPFLKGELVKDGTHINAIGSHTPEMGEIDIDVFKKSSIVVVDSREAVLKEAGEIINAIKASVIKEEDLIELGEVISDPYTKGRKSDSDVTLFKTVGIAVEDIVVGKLVYERAIEKGVGTEIKGFF